MLKHAVVLMIIVKHAISPLQNDNFGNDQKLFKKKTRLFLYILLKHIGSRRPNYMFLMTTAAKGGPSASRPLQFLPISRDFLRFDVIHFDFLYFLMISYNF